MFLCAAGMVFLASCSQTTLENRRDMHFPQKVNGPYTRMADDGIPDVEPVTDGAVAPATKN
jgi:hypothetical protein